ncbi:MULTISPECIES: FAD-dependent monooxygenase [unclassified Amycolatopsis]|uniref:FAD-dependent monooxygenase n=1 Tax=unclassified Amycolatopsis TaxID=2618356 RepID=UPI002876850B|nr:MULTISPECIES: FAD-dependent monooxygenase [unclassified Amycolatopsis]MDS0138279.1 FAD-dependent monooxygenase [Amycolatopsis sp. 505]MDS0149100.1 FAD-dependent monooxygenase [Amycolatopsis sp. CM201R]
MSDPDVLIAGAGPAGLLLAAELALAGVRTTIVERRPERPPYCRGFNLNARALDLLHRRGLAESLVAEGHRVPHAPATGLPGPLLLDGTATDHPFSLGIPQTRVEEVLEARALELGAEILRGHDVRSFTQSADGVATVVHNGRFGRTIHARFLVGCDGGRSTVRKQAGIGFPGVDARWYALLGDVECDLPYGPSVGPDGRSVFVIPRPGYVRIVVREDDPPSDKDTPVTLERLQAQVDAVLGRHVELSAPRWLSRFGDAARLASQYREGRVLLAGDAAHIHPPAGAIGVNVALDDAFNLGWKLAATVHGTAPEGLLDTYHAERHAAGERILANTQAQVALEEAGEEPWADLLRRVAVHPAGNRALAEIITGLDACYEPGGHLWLGRLAPDVPLRVSGVDTQLAALLHAGRPVLLDLTGSLAAWSAAVEVVAAASPSTSDIEALLLRPDGHVAWVGTPGEGDAGLAEAVHRWVGPVPAAV